MNPYANLPDRSFWRTGVAEPGALNWRDLYRKKFEITRETKIAAAGSCFAQHIGRQLKQRGFNYRDYELAPSLLAADRATGMGYGLYSARYGNIYTARQMRQLQLEALGRRTPEERVWQSGGRFFDAQRPSVEPNGFGSEEEVLALRQNHLGAVRRMLKEVDVFIFTMGLTEAWYSKRDGTVFPICPGTIAGEFDPEQHAFVNLTFSDVLRDMTGFIDMAVRYNPALRFVLTVSPVPLTATATDQHVLVATAHSKAILRAVAAELYARYEQVDYFPSFDIVSSAAAGGINFERNQRSVRTDAVDRVMSHFFAEHGGEEMQTAPPPAQSEELVDEEASEFEVMCDEEKLDLVRTQ